MSSSLWTDRLLAWYDLHQRNLPWRRTADPYAKWLSEIMLQQTQVQTVLPYYERFMEEVPTIDALARLDDQRLHKLWEGLGYYRRAGYLKKAAQVLVKDYEGKLPSDHETLLSLPGIGPYTAAAISAMAFNQAYVAMDGNLERVFARILAETEPINQRSVKARLKSCAEAYLSHERPGDYNQALMDLGSTVCVPGLNPLCEDCPWEGLCLARKEGLTHLIPQKAPRKKRRQEKRTVFLHVAEDHILIRQRPMKGLLAGLWEFPNISLGHASLPAAWEAHSSFPPSPLGNHRHIYSHIEWDMQGYLWTYPFIPKHFLGHWVSIEEIESHYPLPAAFQVYYRRALALLKS